MKTCSMYHWNSNRNKAENKSCSLQYLFTVQRYLTFYFYKAVCLCKRQGMSEDSNTSLLFKHFWINFWCLVLFKSG